MFDSHLQMMSNRAELDAALYQLHASLPLWQKTMATQEDLWCKYNDLFGQVLDKTPLADRDYAITHFNDIVASSDLLWRQGVRSGDRAGRN